MGCKLQAKDNNKSDRVNELYNSIALGLGKIAEILNLSVHTVTTHRRNISNKLQIHSSAGIAIYAIVNGLLNLHEIEKMP